MGDLSTLLFARPSFWEGVARLIDVGGTLNEYNVSRSAGEVDQNATLADWTVVGEDLRAAWGDQFTDIKERTEDVKELEATR